MSAYSNNIRRLRREVKEARQALEKAELRLLHLPKTELPNEYPKSGEVLQSGCCSCSKPIKRRFRLWDHKGKWAGDYCTERCADLDAKGPRFAGEHRYGSYWSYTIRKVPNP